MNDREHERIMDKTLKAYYNARSEADRMRLWDQYIKLHAQRSPEQVRRMELEKGLR